MTSPAADTDAGVEPDEEDADAGVDSAPLWAPATRRMRVTTLPNGLTLIAMRRAGLPFVSMVLGFHGEPQRGDSPGVRAALPRTAIWSLQVPASERGFLQTTRLEGDSYQEILELFAGDTTKALGLITEQTQWVRVYWPSAGFSQWLESEARRDASPSGRAYREFRSALFGQHAYHLLPTPAAVRTVTGVNLQDWLRRVRRPQNGALVIVGDIDVDDVSRSVEKSLRNWKGDQAPVASPPAPLRPPEQGTSPRLLFTKAIHRRSTEVRFGCLLPPIQALPGAVRSDALAALIHEDLAHRLRARLGASYGPDVRASTLRGGTAFLEGTVDVEDAALPEALDALSGWLDPARQIPLKPTALERERRSMARRRVFSDAINSQVAVDLFRAWNRGWPLATLDEYPNALARMTVQDLAADLEPCRASAVISVLGNTAPPPSAASPP